MVQTAGPVVGEQLQSAVSQMLRWASRGDVRRALQGPQVQPLSATDAWLLEAIVTQRSVRVSDLALWQGVDKSTVTPQVHRLERRGLVARHGDQRDRRVVWLTATGPGLDLHRELSTAGARYVEGLLQHWTETDRYTLAVLLARFADELAARPGTARQQPTPTAGTATSAPAGRAAAP